MEKKVYSITGQEKNSISLNDKVFSSEVNHDLIYQLIRAELANKRQGTADTRTRGEVSGSTAKPWRQKGTGRARAGHKRSPLWKGGGRIFGPHPRDYRIDIPKKMKHQAYCSIFSLRAQDDDVFSIVENFSVESGKTRDLVSIIKALNIVVGKQRTVLVLSGDSDENKLVRRAGRNIPNLKILNYNRLSAQELFYARKLLFQEDAINNLNTFFTVS